ncbi:MAG: HAD hydrolase-like protein [Eubacterium sp.]
MKKYAFCVDSDGCVMDTMTPKHQLCFGPEAISVWNLEPWEKEAKKRWEEINLWQVTRGIHRFQGIYFFLQEYRDHVDYANELPKLEHWLRTTEEYSEKSLEREIKITNSNLLQQVLNWSRNVNREIEKIPRDKAKVFAGVKEIILGICKEADVYIISSANKEAVCREWEDAGILNYVIECMTQEKGTKRACLRQVFESGYEKNNMLMVGDAVGDKESADSVQIPFFPILAGKEEQSWQEGRQTAFPAWLNGKYTKEMQRHFENQFYKNLGRDEKNAD